MQAEHVSLTGKGSGLLVAAIVGGAIIPVVEGRVADNIGIHHAIFIPVICSLYIATFGILSRALTAAYRKNSHSRFLGATGGPLHDP